MPLGLVAHATSVAARGGTSASDASSADGDPADGLFTTGGAANTGTSVDGNGLFAVPAAQLTTYQPAAPGGYEFTSTPLAALPASAVIVAFTAENM